jgi:chromosome segregation ATPase
MAGRKEIARELSIYINDRQVINSLGGINREIGRVSSEMRNLNKNSQTYDQDLKKLQGTLGGLKEKQSEFKDEIYATGEVAGNAKEKISQIFLGLATGNLKLVQEGLSGIRGSITQ